MLSCHESVEDLLVVIEKVLTGYPTQFARLIVSSSRAARHRDSTYTCQKRKFRDCRNRSRKEVSSLLLVIEFNEDLLLSLFLSLEHD